MSIMNLYDSIESEEYYGILICDNDQIDTQVIQDEIYRIKSRFKQTGFEWEIEDVIAAFPKEWKVHLQDSVTRIKI